MTNFVQPTLEELESSAKLVYRSMPATPQYRWPLLEKRIGATVWVKHENHTPTGAFKVRGGLVYFEDLCKTERPAGVVSATRGNHGQSLGFAAQRYAIPAAVVVPHGNSVEKNAAMKALGVELIESGQDFQDASETADEIAEKRGWHRMPSFHRLLVMGVGTYVLELLTKVADIDTLYVPVGMGSGLCGAIAARDALGAATKIVGVVSAGAPAFALSWEEKRVVSHPVTTLIADGMACRTPNDGALLNALAGAERVVVVTDQEVENAMRVFFSDSHTLVEGAGGASLAALLKEREKMEGKCVAVVASGGNVDTAVYARVLAGG